MLSNKTTLMQRKVMFILLDGLGDRPCRELNGLTPLQKADIPSFDFLATNGMIGRHYPLGPGIPPGSDTAQLSMLGYDIRTEYPGRGYFEALGWGVKIEKGEVLFRVNFATVERDGSNLIVKDRRAGRISGKDAESVASAVAEMDLMNGEIKAVLEHTLEHRGILILKGSDLVPDVTDVDPHEVGYPVLEPQPLTSSPKAKKTALALKEFVLKSYEILKDLGVNVERKKSGLLPANIVLPRGAASKLHIPSFMKKWGFKSAAIAVGPLYKGIAKSVGMKLLEVEGATGLPNSNFKGKIEKGLSALESGFDFVFVHIKGTDVASHMKNPELKVKVLERIDDALESLLDLSADYLLLLTGDHTTPCSLGKHSGDPVPLMISGKGIPKDDAGRFDELRCIRGGIGTVLGKDLMRLVLNYSNRASEHGLRPKPVEIPYIPKPDQLTPLSLNQW
ncbi:MAG: hypothetical protein DRO00_09210 [Thermoproteota archaeon]|nr:MAG: hypothetical protein DRO00_09210 [Candidatus Korarchaeota archaeon]